MFKRQGRARPASRAYGPTAILAVLILFCQGLSEAKAEDWPTTEFVIQEYDPDGLVNVPDWVPGAGFDDKQQKVIWNLQTYLGEVAAYYESMGFRAPQLPMTEDDDGDPAYLVYVYDFASDETTALAGYFSDESVDLRVDLSRAVVNGQPSDRVYEDLAHELFHNVQRAYQSDYALDHGKWIAEGQAQAVGMDTAYKLRGTMRFRTEKEAYRLGGRPYYKPLATNTHDHTYRTSSFWRYLGEHYAASKKNGRAGIKPIPADYSYLADLFEHPFKGPPSFEADLRWLDNALEQEFGLGLDRLYPNFITTFADYVPTRLNKMSGTPAEAAATWRNYIFGECEVVRLEMPLAPTGRIALELDSNAARCFMVYAKGLIAGWADISMTARSGSPETLKALHIGTDAGTKVGIPIVAELPDTAGGGYLGHWRFRIPMEKYQVFVISNVAVDAETSQPQTVTLDLVMSTWLSSMTQPDPQTAPVEPETAKAAPADEAGIAAESDQEEPPADLAFLTNTSALGMEVQVKAGAARCGDQQPFRFNPCGPTTSIQLRLMPGAVVATDVSRIGATGGGLSQALAIGNRNMLARAENLKAAGKRMNEREGDFVRIKIPAIQYGFSGSFSNAAIIVDAGDRDTYEAIGPEDVIPGPGIDFPLSGKVTIDQFTPAVLRGRFSAKLVDMDRVGRYAGPDPVLPVHRTISGVFSITAPWQGDPRVELVAPDASAYAMDLAEISPFMGGAFGDAIRDLIEAKLPDDPDGPAASASGGGGGYSRVPSCDCACLPLASYSPACRPVCEVKVRYCEANESWAIAERQSRLEMEAQTARKEAREAKYETLSSAEKREYASYLLILAAAQMAHGLSGGAEGASEMTRADFRGYLEKMDMDESQMQKMLGFFTQDRAAAQP